MNNLFTKADTILLNFLILIVQMICFRGRGRQCKDTTYEYELKIQIAGWKSHYTIFVYTVYLYRF